MVSVALTGHRPERLGYAKDTYATMDWVRMIDWLKLKIKENSITDVYCGMANGCDIAYGIAALRLKEENYSVKLHCVLPCKNYNSSNIWYNSLKKLQMNGLNYLKSFTRAVIMFVISIW